MSVVVLEVQRCFPYVRANEILKCTAEEDERICSNQAINTYI